MQLGEIITSQVQTNNLKLHIAEDANLRVELEGEQLEAVKFAARRLTWAPFALLGRDSWVRFDSQAIATQLMITVWTSVANPREPQWSKEIKAVENELTMAGATFTLEKLLVGGIQAIITVPLAVN